MKVVLISTFDRSGGAGIACMRLLNALLESDVEAKMLVKEKKSSHKEVISANPGIWKYYGYFNFALERLLFLPYEKNKKYRFYFSPANIGQDIHTNKLVRGADIIHLHWFNQAFISLKELEKLKLLGKPIIWTIHDKWTFTGGCHITKKCYNYEENCGNCFYLKNPNPDDYSNKIWNKKKEIFDELGPLFITCSKWHQSLALKSGLLKNQRVLSIPNAINTSFYVPGKKIESRLLLKLPVEKKIILFIANDISLEYKGFDFLIQAVNGIKFREDIYLLIVGQDKLGKLSSLKLPFTHFSKISSPQKLLDVYQSVDLFVTPTLEDNLPNTVMESMSCGTPVVSFQTGGVPEMVDHKVNGWIAKQRDLIGLRKGIESILKDDSLRLEYGEKARKKVEATYSLEKVASQYIDIYSNLLN